MSLSSLVVCPNNNSPLKMPVRRFSFHDDEDLVGNEKLQLNHDEKRMCLPMTTPATTMTMTTATKIRDHRTMMKLSMEKVALIHKDSLRKPKRRHSFDAIIESGATAAADRLDTASLLNEALSLMVIGL